MKDKTGKCKNECKYSVTTMLGLCTLDVGSVTKCNLYCHMFLLYYYSMMYTCTT